MDLVARRVFRWAGVFSLSLALAYALALPLPFIAPVFACMLTAAPGPPMGLKSLFGLLVLLLVTTAIGLLLTPMLMHYPATAVLLAILGLYLSFYLSVHLGKALVGAFFGFT